MNDPRQHHYMFAHERLPELVFMSRELFLYLLRKNSDGYLKGIWHQIGSTLTRDEQLTADGLTLKFFEDKCYCGAVITLPKALHRTEAHMVALVAERVSGSVLSDDTSDLEYRNLRYFTLEHSGQTTGKAGTTLGEWTYLRHSNYGVGPAVDTGLFWTACTKISLRKTRTRFHKDASNCESRLRRYLLESRRTQPPENLLRFCHPAFWKLGSKND